MLTCLASSSVRTPAARGTTSGTKGVASSITVRRTSVLLRSRTPRIYSSLRFSSAAMVWALMMPRSATTQRWPTPKRARNRSTTDRPFCPCRAGGRGLLPLACILWAPSLAPVCGAARGRGGCSRRSGARRGHQASGVDARFGGLRQNDIRCAVHQRIGAD